MEKGSIYEMSRDNDQNYAYISNEMQLQKHSLTFIHKNKLLLSATSILSRSPMPYNSTASMDLEKLICFDYVDFGKYQERFGQISWTKNDSNYLDVKLKIFNRKKRKKNSKDRWQQRVPTGPKFYKGRGGF